jgi:hypothetical protein
MQYLFILFSLFAFTAAAQDKCTPTDSAFGRKVFTFSDELPAFPGGQEKLIRFVMDNLKFRADMDQYSLYMEFIVEEDGTIKDMGISRKSPAQYSELDKEGLRVLSIMPRWKPGKCDGTPVPFLQIFPIRCIWPQE